MTSVISTPPVSDASVGTQTRTALLLFEPPDGGVTENVLQLALRIRSARWSVVVAGPELSNIRARLEEEGIEYVVLEHLRRGYGRPPQDMAALREIKRVLRGRRFDVVHTHASKAGFLGRLAASQVGIPAIYSPHCFGFVGDVSTKRRLFALGLERWLGRHTDGLLCVSDAERRLAIQHKIVPPDVIRHIRHGVDCGPDEANEELLAFRGDGLLVGAVTVLREQKRLDVLIDAIPAVLEAMPKARFAIVGNGPTGDELRAQADRMGLIERGAVKFFDFAPPSTQWLRALDVYVLPSAWEAMPIGALEALACGVPQVVSRVDGADEIVTPQTGTLVAPKDVGGLAAALIGLLADDGRRLAAARASRRRADDVFPVDDMVASTVDFYEACIERLQPDAPAPSAPRRSGRFSRATRTTSF
ncbi:MAG TPA: glycosyltransferase [Baekduia sp.]|nr:glycosyltransferase [Baekduia sp.]